MGLSISSVSGTSLNSKRILTQKHIASTRQCLLVLVVYMEALDIVVAVSIRVLISFSVVVMEALWL